MLYKLLILSGVFSCVRGGMENVQQHTFTLARYTYAALCSLRYPSGAPVVRIYSDSEFHSPEAQGPVINFNVLDASGNIVGYSQVGFLSIAPTCSQQDRSCLGLGSLPNPETCSQGLRTLAGAVMKPRFGCGGQALPRKLFASMPA